MEYRILGPLEVLDGERALQLGGGKQRALLAFLLLHANEIVSNERLVDELWGERPPATAAKIVQNYVSRLRKDLEGERGDDGAGVLVTRGHGYVFRLDPGQLDVNRFDALAAEGREALRAGRADEAAHKLREALALWRGAALADLAYEPFAQVWTGRLEESRLHALEDRIEADLALGRHAEVIAELEGLVRAHPLRERLRVLLMLSLYRSGRQADALRAYQETRRALVEELGIEPGPDLQRLNKAILLQDESLDLRPREEAAEPESDRGEAKRSLISLSRYGRRGRLVLAVAAVAFAGALAVVAAMLSHGDPAGPTTVPGNSVAVVDPASGRVRAAIPVGAHPTSVAVGEGAVWVLNADDQTVSRIDPRTRAVKTFAIGTTPADLAAGGGAVWVQGEASSSTKIATVSRLHPRTGVVSATTRLPTFKRVSSGFGTTSGGSTIAVGRHAVWVVNRDLTVSRLDPDTGALVATVRTVSANTIAAGLDAFWVVNLDGTIARIDPQTNRVTTRFAVPSTSLSAIAAGAGALWVTDPVGGNVWRIDPRGPRVVMATVPLAFGAAGIAVGEGAIWISNGVERTLTRIDPTSNDVETVRLTTSPLAVAAGEGAVWTTVAGGGPSDAPEGDAGLEALPESSCGEVLYEGDGTPRFLIASDLPLQGRSRLQAASIVEAIKLVLKRHKYKAGEYTVAYQSCDDSTAQAQGFEYEKCASNAYAYAANEHVVGVVGSYNSDCSWIEIPIANQAPGGPLAMISPSNSAVGLTHPAPSQPQGELSRLYPTGERNFARVFPPDDYQAAALAIFARELGLRRVFVLRDHGGGGYALDLSTFFVATARKLGLDVVGESEWDARTSSYRRLARSVRAARPDAVLLAGAIESNGGRLIRDLRAVLGRDVAVLAGDGFSRNDAVLEAAGSAAEDVYASAVVTTSEALGEAGHEFMRQFRAARPGWLTRDYYWAPYGAQAAEVLLDAIASSDGSRASVTRELLAADVEDGILGTFGFDKNGDMTRNPITIVRLGRRGPGISEADLDFAEGATVERVITPSPALHE